MQLKISEIKIGMRRREDYGNIQELADSIKKYGLLHPVVLDVDNNLVAGGRRLEACKLINWSEIPCTYLENLSNKELRAIELEENLRRKDLTENELSRNLVELAEIKAEEFRSNSDQNYLEIKRPIGRPAKPDSLQKIAESIGIPKTTLIEAKQHVEAIDKYPELKEVPKMQAIDTAKKLDSLLEENRIEARREILKKQESPEDMEERLIRRARDKFDLVVKILSDLHEKDIERYMSTIDEFDTIPYFADGEEATLKKAYELFLAFIKEYLKHTKPQPGNLKVLKGRGE
jgi:ParB-like chromosome segregation protein Spo0J